MLLIKTLISLTALVICDSAKILAVFPIPSISHYIALRPFVEELARRGHELTVITADPAYPKGQTPPNYVEIDVHPEAYSFRESILSIATGNGTLSQIDPIFELLYHVFDNILRDSTEVQSLLQDETKKFDLLLLEACVRTTLTMQHMYKVPAIQISSFGPMEMNNFVFGSATHPILYPTIHHQRLFNLNLWEKIIEITKYYYVVFKGYYYEKLETQAMRVHFPDLPSLKELSDNVDLLFLNVNPIWEMNRPVPPNVIYLGGLQLKPAKELPKELKSYLDSSKEGVIYMSFGTNVGKTQIPEETVAVFMQVFSELPYNVLWKWEDEEVPGLPSNVKLGKWFPQADLLKHPNIKLFITQGGLQSAEEAIAAGVPLLSIPMLGDQWANTEKFEYFKIGLGLNIAKVTEKKFKNAITTIIDTESYRENIIKLRTVMTDQPQTPLERGVWWTEYLLRHGNAKHLRSPAANMSWCEYLILDVVLLVLVVFIVVVGALRNMFRSIGQICTGKKKTD